MLGHSSIVHFSTNSAKHFRVLAHYTDSGGHNSMNLRDRALNGTGSEGMGSSLTPECLEMLGQSDRHLIQLQESPGPARVHRELAPALQCLSSAAQQAGFELRIASGYRDFERQLAIWNAKASGERPVLGEQGELLDVATLSNKQTVDAIMRWSALPGASRHHWGSDIDVYDAAALPEGEAVQLTRAESESLFAPFHEWLSNYISSEDNPGFYRPYDVDRGGVAPEPWHLSYAPLACQFERLLTPELLQMALRESDIALKAEVLASLPELFARFVHVPQAPRSLFDPEKPDG